MIDTHIHLESENYGNDRDEVIARFFDDGGKAIVNIGVDEDRINKALKIAEKYQRVYVAAGFHPQEGTDLFRKTGSLDFLQTLKSFVGNPKIVAIGEIGLDYFRPSGQDHELKINKNIKEIQKKAFVEQLELAKKFNLPVVIHCRDAYSDLYKILKSRADIQKSKAVIHCYGGSVEDTKKFLELPGMHFSFTGNITFEKDKNAKIFQVIKMIPMERIMVETDGPFLAPVPHRGKRNEPGYVKYVIEKIAEVKGLNSGEVENSTDQAAIEFFGIKIS